MGSWIETCAISGLPINHGHEVGVIYLTQSSRRPDLMRDCYSTDSWRPCTLPIWGKYDDYGRIAFHEHKSQADLLRRTKDFIEDLRDASPEAEEAHGEHHWERTELGGDYGFRTSQGTSYLPVLVRRDVWREYQKISIPSWSGPQTKEEVIKEWWEIMVGDENYKESPDKYKIGFWNSFMGYHLSVREVLDGVPSKREQGLMKDLWWVNVLFGYARKSWAPTAGHGSQSEIFSTRRAMYKVYDRLAKKNDFP